MVMALRLRGVTVVRSPNALFHTTRLTIDLSY